MKSVLIISDDQQLTTALNAEPCGNQFTFNVLPSREHVVEKLVQLKPDLVVIDFLLNNGNGGAICHEIRGHQELNPLPLIMLTDYPNIQRFTAKFGCNAIIHKPITASELIDTLTTMLEDPAMAPQFLVQAS